MKGSHVQKENRFQTMNMVLGLTAIVMVVVCTLIAITTIRDLRELEKEAEETKVSILNLGEDLKELEKGVEGLKVSILNLERSQDGIPIPLTNKATDTDEDQASIVKEPTEPAYMVTVAELQTLAKIVYREAMGIPQKSHQAAVIWCILNRVDNGYWGDDIITVATYPNAFAWVPDTPIKEEFMNLAIDVVTRWNWEKQGLQDVGRTLPSTYLYFTGDGEFNHFTEKWGGTEYWDWSLPDPYLS